MVNAAGAAFLPKFSLLLGASVVKKIWSEKFGEMLPLPHFPPGLLLT